jgi:hypothetical protein
MIKRFARWILRKDLKLMYEIGDKVWTGYVELTVVAQNYSRAINGDHEVTLRLMRHNLNP